MKFLHHLLPLLLVLLVSTCNDDSDVKPTGTVRAVSETQDGHDVLAKGFTIPWAIEVIDENEYLITERLGQLYYYNDGTISRLENLPGVSTVSDGYLTYGGLMDVSLHPQFATNGLVYFTYVGPDYRMRVGRFELREGAVRNLNVVFETDAFSIGSRIAWQDDDHFFVSQGSGGNPYPEPGGQDLGSDVGKIHRLKKDGQVPIDNPVFDGQTQPTSIWSYGHRDPQGLYFDQASGVLYSSEHGPQGGDELNVILKGENYGWPAFSHGLNYDGTAVSAMTEEEAQQISQLPIHRWTPSIAPSSLVKLIDSRYTQHNGAYLMGSLSQQCIIRYDVGNDSSEKLWEGLGRVRDIAELPSGELVVLLDADSPDEGDEGRLIRLR